MPVAVRGTSSSVMKTMRRGILKLESRSRSAARRPSSVGAGAGSRDDRGGDDLADVGVGQPRDERELDLGQLGERGLDLEPRHIGRARLDHVAGAPDEPRVAVGVDPHEVLGRVEAIGREHLVAVDLVEAGHQAAAAELQLTDLAGRNLRPVSGSTTRRSMPFTARPDAAVLVVGHPVVDGLAAVHGEALGHAEEVGAQRPGDRFTVLVPWPSQARGSGRRRCPARCPRPGAWPACATRRRR